MVKGQDGMWAKLVTGLKNTYLVALLIYLYQTLECTALVVSRQDATGLTSKGHELVFDFVIPDKWIKDAVASECWERFSWVIADIYLSDPTTAGLLGDNLTRNEDIDMDGRLIFRDKYLPRPHCVTY
jgi:hypothetical protein